MINYVLGFAFSKNARTVVLIEKQQPLILKDKLTGVGGKIEPLELPINAMYREFREETGVDLIKTGDVWDYYARVNSYGFTMAVFRVFTDAIYQVRSVEMENVGTYNTELKLRDWGRIVPDTRYLIPMALDENLKFTEINLK